MFCHKPFARVRVLGGCAALICICAAAALTGCRKAPASAQPQKKTPLVVAQPVQKGEIVRSIDLSAEVVAVEAVQISSTSEGPISFCPWREGDRVEAGQKLIEIDRETYRAEVMAAEAAVGVAKAKLEDLKAGTRPEEIDKARQSLREAEQTAEFETKDLERVASLVKSRISAQEELEKSRVKMVAAETKLKSARRQLEMLESGFTPTAIAVQEAVIKEAAAKLALARARLGECAIAAPFAGTITKVHVRRGDMAAMKAPLLEMCDMASLVLRCGVPEANASQVRNGMKGRVQLDALPGKTFQAQLSRVFPELDRRMRTITVEFSAPEGVAMAAGMFARIRLVLESVPDAVTVPVESIAVSPAGGHLAFVASEGKALQRKVAVGIEDAGRIQVLSGLKPGEQVIVSGNERLKDGAEIRLGSRGAGPSGAGPGQAKGGPEMAGADAKTQPAGRGGQ